MIAFCFTLSTTLFAMSIKFNIGLMAGLSMLICITLLVALIVNYKESK